MDGGEGDPGKARSTLAHIAGKLPLKMPMKGKSRLQPRSVIIHPPSSLAYVLSNHPSAPGIAGEGQAFLTAGIPSREQALISK